jgi:hypothetical protein
MPEKNFILETPWGGSAIPGLRWPCVEEDYCASPDNYP